MAARMPAHRRGEERAARRAVGGRDVGQQHLPDGRLEPRREQQRHAVAAARYEHGLDQRLRDQASPGGSKRSADRGVAPAARGANQQQRRGVSEPDREHQSRNAGQPVGDAAIRRGNLGAAERRESRRAGS